MILSVQVWFYSSILFPGHGYSVTWLVALGARTECKVIPFGGEHNMGASKRATRSMLRFETTKILKPFLFCLGPDLPNDSPLNISIILFFLNKLKNSGLKHK